MTATTWSPGPIPAAAAPTSVTPGAAPIHGDGWIFMPASPHSTAPKGAIAFPAAAAAGAAAAAIRATGHTAWRGVGPTGAWGTFIAV